jgi:hypothetical protein
MEQPENSGLKSLAELVAITELSPQAIRRAAREGFIPPPVRGRWPVAAALVGLIKFLSQKSEGLPIYDSIAACTGASGIPQSVLKDAKKAGCEAFHSNRVGLKGVLTWLFTKEAKSEGGRKVYDHFRGLREKLHYEREAGETLIKGEVENAIRRGMSKMFTELDHLAHVELPPDLKGLPEDMIESRLVSSIDALKTILEKEWRPIAANGETVK